MANRDTGGELLQNLRELLPRKVRDKARCARLTRFARIMGGKDSNGRPIAQRVILNDEGRACTDGKTVWLPRTMHDDEVMNLAMQEGILAHEAAGHLRYTDFGAWERMCKNIKGGDETGGDPLLHHIVNIMEDARVNYLLGQDFAGSGKRLDMTQEHFYEKHCEMWEGKSDNDRQGALIAMMSECIINKASPARSPDIDSFMGEVRSILKTAVGQPNTRSVIKQSERVLAVYRRYWPRQVDTEDGEGEGNGSGGCGGVEGSEYQWIEDNDAGDIMGDDMSPEEIQKTAEKCREKGIKSEDVERGRFRGREQPTTEDAEEASGSSDDEGEDGDSDSDSDSDSEPDEVDPDASGDEGGDEAKEADTDNDERGNHSDYSEIEMGDMGDSEGEDIDNVDDLDGLSDEESEAGELWGDLRSELEDALEDEREEAYEIEADDVAEREAAEADIEEMEAGVDDYDHEIQIQAQPGDIVDSLADDGEEARERYQHIVNDNKGGIETLVGEIRRTLESRTNAVTRGQRRGQVDQRNLWKHRTNSRVFMVENRPKQPHAAVSLLIDASGSMGRGVGSRAHYATEAGIVLAEVMNKLGFAFEVVDFNSMWGGAGAAGYTSMNVRKPFEGQMNDLSRAAIATDHTGSENSDGHAVDWCIKRVQKQEATHRFVFTISDGQPAGPCPATDQHPSVHLKRIVGNCPSDVEIFSIGIAGMDTSKYYENAVSIPNTAALAETVLPVLRKMLGQMGGVA